MNKLCGVVLGGSLLLSGMSAYAVEISGNVALNSDYIYRGISQTNENPAISGGFDIAGESGLYAGVWASNVAFDGSVEIDVYAGYAGSFSEEVDYDIGVLRYEYPDDAQAGAPDSSFNEIYGSVGFKGVTVGFAYSSDFFYESGKSVYLYVDYELGLPNDFTLAFHYADQSIDDEVQFGTPDYNEYSIGISKSFMDIDYSLTWFDTDLSRTDCFAGSDICESRIVFGLSKSL